MARIETVFLAGPDLWFPDAETHLEDMAEVCRGAGLTARFGRTGLKETARTEVMAREIYANALAAVRGSDALIANLTPWRGPNADPGTAFEMGFASALGKPVLAYMNVTDEDDADHRSRIEAMVGAVPGGDGRWFDMDDGEIEDLSLPENVMLWAEARRFFVIVTPEPFSDTTGLSMCLDALGLYSE